MFKTLNGKSKKFVFYGAVMLVFYLAYAFAFDKTLRAIQLNNQLSKGQIDDLNLSTSYAQLKQKNDFYNKALKAYWVKADDRENRLWQAVSGMAIANGVAISFNLNQQTEKDTIEVAKSIVRQQFTFTGEYFDLVKLTDTLSRSKGIGRIADLKIFTRKDSQKSLDEKLDMRLSLVAIEK